MIDSNKNSEPTGTASDVQPVDPEKIAFLRAEMPRLWKEFVNACTLDTWSEQEILLDGKKTVNFHGSVEAYRKLFMKTVDGLFS